MATFDNFFKQGTFIVLLMAVSSSVLGQSKIVINKRITYLDTRSVKFTPWNKASDRCASIGMRLCMKKDLCIFSRTSTSDVPRRFVKSATRDTYVPVGDTYNDWVYLGPRRLNQCRRMTEYAGPPMWRGYGCDQAVKPGKVFLRFCQSNSGIYCCRRPNITAQLVPHPTSVYVTRYMQNNSIFQSFSLDAPRLDNSNVQLVRTENILKEVKKFSLMSMKVDGKFEDPIFFCSRQVKNKNGELVDYFYVGNKWCNWGWILNFYLYGSLTQVPDSQKFEANALGFGKNLRTGLTINGEVSRSAASFAFYGPKFKDGAHIEFFSKPKAKTTCTKEPMLLTSLEGLINSAEYDRKKDICRWKIRAPPSSVVKIQFLRLNLKPIAKALTSHQSSISSNQYVGRRISNYEFYKTCSEEKVEIFGYGRFCGNVLPPTFITIDNEIDIAFIKTGENIEESQSEFSLSYEVVAPPNGLIRKRLYDTKLTWAGASDTCAVMAKTLCKAGDICEYTGGRPFYGVQENDQWTPIIDEFNDWLQIGRGNVQTCRRHNNMFGPPIWGISGAECNISNEYIPCPKRYYLYCCNPSNSLPPTGRLVDVSIYSIVLHDTVFYKYLREGIDEISLFDDSSSLLWTRRKIEEEDFSTIKLNFHYSPVFDKVLYFCQQEVVPAIKGLRFTYSVLSKPCESQGWKYLFHLYGMSKSHPGTVKHYVGIYERRPHHSRIRANKFPSDYESENSYVFYSYIPQPIMADSAPEIAAEQPSCGELNSNLVAPAMVMSPGYPTSYQNHLDCKWTVRKPSNSREDDVLKLMITELDLEDPVDILTVRIHSDASVIQSKSEEKVRTLTGIVRQVTIETKGYFELHFVSDASISKKGFRIKIDIISAQCGGSVRVNEDLITSPNYPSSYPTNSECEWLIEAPSRNHDIEIQVVALDLVADEECSDRIVVSSRHIKSDYILCGNKTSTENIFLNGSTAAVYLYTSDSDPKSTKTKMGFALRVYFRERPTGSIPLQCGVQSVPFGYSDPAEERIVGGAIATIANFPWLVHIEGNITYCAGTLLSKSWVLTAAHCLIKTLDADGGRVLHGEVNTFKLVVGRHKRYLHNPGEQVRRAIRAQFRTDYRELAHLVYLNGVFSISTFAYNDIVLLKMDKDVEFSPLVQPICLPTQDAHVGDTCYVAGWGDISSDRTRSVFLHYAKAPILASELCNSYPLMRSTVYKNALCAGYPAGGSGMCDGDSGGPLFCRGKYGNFYINGITSWSVGCAEKKAPGVYARVFNFVDWIKKSIAD